MPDNYPVSVPDTSRVLCGLHLVPLANRSNDLPIVYRHDPPHPFHPFRSLGCTTYVYLYDPSPGGMAVSEAAANVVNSDTVFATASGTYIASVTTSYLHI